MQKVQFFFLTFLYENSILNTNCKSLQLANMTHVGKFKHFRLLITVNLMLTDLFSYKNVEAGTSCGAAEIFIKNIIALKKIQAD